MKPTTRIKRGASIALALAGARRVSRPVATLDVQNFINEAQATNILR